MNMNRRSFLTALASLPGCGWVKPTPAVFTEELFNEELFNEPSIYYISPKGRDIGIGTREDPWRTLSHACDRVKNGDIIKLMLEKL